MSSQSIVSSRIAAVSVVAFAPLLFPSHAGAQIKVACVGDSITDFNTYEPSLQKMLDDTYGAGAYTVLNFGVSGKTATRTGSNAADYTATQKFIDAQNAAPDIVTILLGTNDSRCGDMPTRFVPDYLRIVDTFLALPKVPKVYAMDSSFMPNDGHWSDNDAALVAGVIPRIHDVTRQRHLPSVDLHTPTFGHVEWVANDNVHPDGNAGAVMAAAIFRAITGRRPPEYLYSPANLVPTNNSLTNGDIESGTPGWTSNGGGTISLETATIHGGTKSLKISGRTGSTQGPALDVTSAVQASGPGDYFFEAWARLASLASGSANATLTLTVTSTGSPTSQTFSTSANPVSTAVWTNFRAAKRVTWNGNLTSAKLSFATNSGILDPFFVDDAVLEFRGLYSTTAPKGYPNTPGQLVEPSYLIGNAVSTSQIDLGWSDNSNAWTPVEAGNSMANTVNETAFTIQRAMDIAFTKSLVSTTVAADTVTQSVTGLAAGTTYYFRVRADGASGSTAWTNIAAVTTQGTAAGPAAPTTLAASSVADTTVALAWADVATSETGYRVEWASDPNMVHVSDTVVLPAGATSYTVTGLTPSSTYAFRVRSLGSSSDSAPSNTIQKVTYRQTPDGSALNFGVAVASNTQANLTWVDNCTNETGWIAEWATNAAFTQGFGSSPLGSGIAKNATSYSVTGLAAGSTYYFRVRPYNSIGNGDNVTTPQFVQGGNSNVVTQALPPNAPSGFSVFVSSASQANLSWTDNSANETGFIVERASDSGFTQNLVSTTLPENATSYVATGLMANTTFYFRVRARNSGGDSTNVAAVSFTTPNAGTPNTPSGASATTISKSQIDLSWSDNSSDETGFSIDRATDSAFSTNLVTTTASANAVSASITGLSPLTVYYFRVRATNAAGASVNSPAVSATTLPLPPTAPTSLTISSVTEARVALTWTDNSTTEDGFRIDRATDANFTQNVVTGTVAAGVLNYTATGLSENTTYYFRVKSYNTGGNSGDSNAVNATTPSPTIPPAPSGMTGTAVSESQINLAWLDNSFNETGIKLDRATNATFTQNLATTTLATDSVTSNVTGLATTTTYYFRVRALNGAGESANSNTVTVATLSNVLAAKDPFAGNPGDSLNIASGGNNGGSGWSTNWTADPASNPDSASYKVAADSLVYTDASGAKVLTSGNRAVVNAPASYKQANRSTNIYAGKMSGGGPLDIWFSCLFKPGAGSWDFNPWSKDPYNVGPGARGGTSLAWTNNGGWLGGGTETKSAPNVTLQANQVNLIICRYEVAADKHSLKWTWYINPSDLTNPTNTATKVVWTASNPTGTLKGLDGFGIRNVSSNSAFELDELRYGDSVQLVTPYHSTPAAPTGLTAVPVSTSQINLAWSDSSNNETAFEIDRATDQAFTQNFVSVNAAANSTTYNATGLAANTTFYFRIRATNAAGDSVNSNVVSAVSASPAAVPVAAANPSPLNGATGVSISPTLSWAAGSGATSHRIYLGTANPPSLLVEQSSANYQPGTLAYNTVYYWRIDEVNGSGVTAGMVWSFRTGGLPDTVGDGIPDAWRASHFGGNGQTTNATSDANADPDGDGKSNKEEYLSGTDPNKSQDSLVVTIAVAGANVSVSFSTVAAGNMEPGYERYYSLEAMGDLIDATPEEVGRWIGQGQVVTTTITPASRQFFKVRCWLEPK